MGTHVLLESAKAAGIKRFIHVSTDEVYGEQGADQCAMDEEQGAYSLISVSEIFFLDQILFCIISHVKCSSGTNEPLCGYKGWRRVFSQVISSVIRFVSCLSATF